MEAAFLETGLTAGRADEGFVGVGGDVAGEGPELEKVVFEATNVLLAVGGHFFEGRFVPIENTLPEGPAGVLLGGRAEEFGYVTLAVVPEAKVVPGQLPDIDVACRR